MEKMNNAYKILVGKPEEKIDSRVIGIDGRVVLK
jgi:hypothetical protein